MANLCAGFYSVTATDANNCTATQTITITQPAQIVVNLSPTASNCTPNTGSVISTVTGGTGTYVFLWSNANTNNNINGLSPNTYSVVVRDANACSVTQSATVANGCTVSPCALLINTTLTQTSCSNTCNGAIQVGISNANGLISYTWNNGRTTQNINGLCPNTYTLTVTDGNNCRATINNLVINMPQPLSSVMTTTLASCNGADGQATIRVLGGTAPYLYLWNNGQQSLTASGLNAGAYLITVTDANGCSISRAATIGLNNTLAVTSPVVLRPASCFGINNGSAFVSAAGGNNISFAWSNGESTATATALASGQSTLTVSSTGACVAIRTVAISSPPQIVVNLNSTQTNCIANSGLIAAFVSGGSGAGYQYAWSNGASSSVVTGLTAGQYSLTATDGNNCSAVSTTTISIPIAPTVVLTHTIPSCNSPADITATVSPVGNYTFLWSNGSTTQNLSGIAGGIYQLEVRNGNCVATVRDTVPTVPPMTINFSVTLPTNPQTIDGSLSATASNGTAPFSYLWNTGSSSSVLVGIGSGLYIVSATDANGCTATDTLQLGSITDVQRANTDLSFTVQPNPSAGQFHIVFNSALNGAYTVRLHDVLGRNLWQQAFDSPNLSLPLDMSPFPAACYFISIQQRERIVTQKLIIAR